MDVVNNLENVSDVSGWALKYLQCQPKLSDNIKYQKICAAIAVSLRIKIISKPLEWHRARLACCSRAILKQRKSWVLLSGLNYFSTPCGNKRHYMKQPAIPLTPHLSMTARHSFLQVKRLPRRRRKVPGAVVMGGGVCLHSISSIASGAGRMFRVAPKNKVRPRTFQSIIIVNSNQPNKTKIHFRSCSFILLLSKILIWIIFTAIIHSSTQVHVIWIPPLVQSV